MSQTMWGKIDRANNSPIWATAQVNKTANTANRDALYNNTTADAYITGATIGTFGVSVAEMSDAGIGQVGTVTVTAAGSGFTSRPTVSFAGGGVAASGATATATAKLVSITKTAGGSSYANGEVVTIDGGTSTIAANVNILTTNSTGGVLTVSINAAGSYTTLPTLANNTPTGGSGTGLKLNLSYGVLAVTMTANGSNYTSAPTVTFGGGGTGATATAAVRSEQSKVTSAGWVLRKAFGNRVQYETLVAAKTITSDGNDDTQLPE